VKREPDKTCCYGQSRGGAYGGRDHVDHGQLSPEDRTVATNASTTGVASQASIDEVTYELSVARKRPHRSDVDETPTARQWESRLRSGYKRPAREKI